MAKKKSSKKSNMGLILSLVILALGVAAFCMAFIASVKNSGAFTGTEHSSYTGFQVMFGYSEKVGEVIKVETQILNFSFMATLAFVLPLIGSVLSLIDNKIIRFVGTGLMVAGAVLLFLFPNFVIPVEATELFTRSLGIGAILGGVFAGLGGLVGLYNTVRK